VCNTAGIFGRGAKGTFCPPENGFAPLDYDKIDFNI